MQNPKQFFIFDNGKEYMQAFTSLEALQEYHTAADYVAIERSAYDTLKSQFDALVARSFSTEQLLEQLKLQLENLKEDNQIHSNLAFERGQEIEALKSENEQLKQQLAARNLVEVSNGK